MGLIIMEIVKVSIAGFLCMGAGSQCVHMYYKPLADFPDWVEKAKEELRKEHREKKENTLETTRDS